VPFEQYCIDVLLAAVQPGGGETLELLGLELEDERALELLGVELELAKEPELEMDEELLCVMLLLLDTTLELLCC
jgi:hypothetical protein